MAGLVSLIQGNSDLLWDSFLVMLELNAASIAFALVLGIAIGVGRHCGPRLLDYGLGLFVDVIRSIPILVIVVWTFFAFPYFLDLPALPPLAAGVIALGMHSGAYIAEVVRGGMGSVRAGQMQAGLALGMSPMRVIWRVILPQALVRSLPAIGNRVSRNIKDSVLTSTIAVKDLFWAGILLNGELSRPFLIYTTLMVFYFIVTELVSRAFEGVYQRVATLGRA
jgi:polar amino acid transport system permease protein